MTQKEANGEFKSPYIKFYEGYSIKVQLMWFGFAFSTVSPVCLPISGVGILLSYFLQKAEYAKIYSIPGYGASRIQQEFVDLLDATPLLVSLMNLFVHELYSLFYGIPLRTDVAAALFLNLGLGLFVFLMPWADIVTSIVARNLDDRLTSYDEAGIE